MTQTAARPEVFADLRLIVRAWSSTAEAWIEQRGRQPGADAKTHAAHKRRFADTDTMMALGYVLRLTQSDPVAMLARIVGQLADKDPAEAKRLRQDLTRRYDALHYFGLVRREKPHETLVTLERTALTETFQAAFDAAYENQKTADIPSGRANGAAA